jgi:hypothetical protein
MGVMLTLDGPRQARARRPAQHKRSPDQRACVDAFAAFLRYDGPGAGRHLSRLATTVLARKILPAAKALAGAVDIVLAGAAEPPGAQSAAAPAARNVTLNFTVSPACLVGLCRIEGSGSCHSVLCGHDCHCRQRSAAGRVRWPVG